MEQQENVLKVDINLLIPNSHQPRRLFNSESLKELSNSIKEYGILNPILVRKKDNTYEIIAGERRMRAAKMAGLNEVPVIIKNIDDSKMAELALIENLQRENITPIEEAKSYEEILKSTNITEQKLSEMIGKSQSFISNKLRLLSLPETIQEALNRRKISERHARSLLTIKDVNKQNELLNRIINEKLSVKELDNIINEKKITEEEIQSAINDIMKSLNISDENNQKEEKESDNMNNGNFFPNFNNNVNPNNNVSLNSMNMQTMGNNPMPEQTTNFGQPNMVSTTNTVAQHVVAPEPSMVEQSIPNTNLEPNPNPIPDFSSMVNPQMSENQEFNQPVNDLMTPPSPEIPLFNIEQEPTSNTAAQQVVAPEPSIVTQPVPSMPEINIPNVNIEPTMAEQQITTPMADTPLFNPEVTMPTVNTQEEPTNLNESFYEVPVNISPVIENPTKETDKLTKVTNLLSSNGVEYKLYSNETGHCIIIEL